MDYTQIQSNVVIVRRSIGSLPVIITTNGDQISQEGDEDFFLVLNPIIGTLPANFFLRDRLRIVIQDTTGKELHRPIHNNYYFNVCMFIGY